MGRKANQSTQLALKAVCEGETVKAAAELFCVKYKTLERSLERQGGATLVRINHIADKIYESEASRG